MASTTTVPKTEADASSPITTPPDAADASPVAQEKRRATRRASTAERRASHNAVERMRRETLNGRFLTLASLLPPLAALRRPSKAAIVGSSIATLNAARRHRVLAAQTLRSVTKEAEALRREINTWRARANIPPLEAPPRTEAHAAVLRGEIEDIDVEVLLEEAGEDDDLDDALGPDTPADSRFAFQPEHEGGAEHASRRPMTGSMPRTPPSPSSASSGSWEGSRTPPASAGLPILSQPQHHMSMGVGMGMGVDAALKQQMYAQQQQVYDAQQKIAQIARAQAQMAASVSQMQTMPGPVGPGAGYDLGLGLAFDEELGMGMGVGVGMGLGAGAGWASASPQHPAFYAQQHPQHGPGAMFDHHRAHSVYGVQGGQYLHQPARFA